MSVYVASRLRYGLARVKTQNHVTLTTRVSMACRSLASNMETTPNVKKALPEILKLQHLHYIHSYSKVNIQLILENFHLDNHHKDGILGPRPFVALEESGPGVVCLAFFVLHRLYLVVVHGVW